MDIRSSTIGKEDLLGPTLPDPSFSFFQCFCFLIAPPPAPSSLRFLPPSAPSNARHCCSSLVAAMPTAESGPLYRRALSAMSIMSRSKSSGE